MLNLFALFPGFLTTISAVNLSAILLEIISLLTSGITEFGTGMAAGIVNYVEKLAITGTGETAALSVFMGIVVIFASIALVVGITRKIGSFLGSLGGSRF